MHLFDITYNCDLVGLAHMHKGHEYIKCMSQRVISKFIITQFYLTGNKKSVLPKVRRKLGAGSKLLEKDQRLVLEVSERLGKE